MVLTLEDKIRVLEQMLKTQSEDMYRISRRNEELQLELLGKESMRMSQLESLAVRNTELEKEIHRCKSTASV